MGGSGRNRAVKREVKKRGKGNGEKKVRGSIEGKGR